MQETEVSPQRYFSDLLHQTSGCFFRLPTQTVTFSSTSCVPWASGLPRIHQKVTGHQTAVSRSRRCSTIAQTCCHARALGFAEFRFIDVLRVNVDHISSDKFQSLALIFRLEIQTSPKRWQWIILHMHSLDKFMPMRESYLTIATLKSGVDCTPNKPVEHEKHVNQLWLEAGSSFFSLAMERKQTCTNRHIGGHTSGAYIELSLWRIQWFTERQSKQSKPHLICFSLKSSGTKQKRKTDIVIRPPKNIWTLNFCHELLFSCTVEKLKRRHSS